MMKMLPTTSYEVNHNLFDVVLARYPFSLAGY